MRNDTSPNDGTPPKIKFTPQVQIKDGYGLYFYRIKQTIFIPREGYATQEGAELAAWRLLWRFPECEATWVGEELEDSTSELGVSG